MRKNLSWSFLDLVLQQSTNFIISLIIVRVLTPADFGIVAIITSITAILSSVITGLFSDVIVKHGVYDITTLNSMISLLIIIGIFLAGITFIIAPYFSRWYVIPDLTYLIRFASLSLLIVGISSILRARLVLRLDFRILALSSLIAVVISGIVAISLGFNDYGPFSLVVRTVLGQFITLLLLFYFTKDFQPKLVLNMTNLVPFVKDGTMYLGIRIINTVSVNLSGLVMSNIIGVSTLGILRKSESINSLFSNNLSQGISRYAFPKFAELNQSSDSTLLFKEYKKLILLTFSFGFAFTLGVLICSKSLVRLLFGENWIDSAHYLEILTISYFPFAIWNINLYYISVVKGVKIHSRLEWMHKGLSVFALITVAKSLEFYLWTQGFVLWSMCLCSFILIMLARSSFFYYLLICVIVFLITLTVYLTLYALK